MASIKRVTVGQTLYTVTRQKMGNTAMSHSVTHTVTVIEVDPESRFVIASWNGNTARRYRERDVARWKVNKPGSRK